MPGSVSAANNAALMQGRSAPAFKTPILVAFDFQTHSLIYWQVTAHGGGTTHQLSPTLNIESGYAAAANGNVVYIANYYPPKIFTFDVKSHATSTSPDPFGKPFDIAIDKKGTAYALSQTNVAVYRAGSSKPSELSCRFMTNGVAIAVDNEADVFVNGDGPNHFTGVVEYPVGSSNCKKLQLRPERVGFAAGIGIDPKTDDLLVISNPGGCVGSPEGQMVIYPKPYKVQTSHQRTLGATYCLGHFRLNANSTLVFAADSLVSDGYPIIDQHGYPNVRRDHGIYGSADSFGGLTTIPNTLPN
jgi:hypothetical protein